MLGGSVRGPKGTEGSANNSGDYNWGSTVPPSSSSPTKRPIHQGAGLLQHEKLYSTPAEIS